MSTPEINSPQALDAVLLNTARSKRNALLREARGRRLYTSDVIFILVALCDVAVVALSHHYDSLWAAMIPMALLAGYGARISRQLQAVTALLENSDRKLA